MTASRHLDFGRPRLALALPTIVLALLVSGCSSPEVATPDRPGSTTTNSPSTSAPFARADLSARPLVWLQPLPKLVDESLPFNDGSVDFYDLFSDDAAWTVAAGRTHVFGVYGTYVRHYATDDDLRRLIDGVEKRGLALAMEVGPLPSPPSGECIGGEGFGGIYEIELVQRIKDLGGTVGVVALDEPYAFGHKADGPTDCRWPVERVAAEVAEFVRLLREVEPNVIVGDIEPMWAHPQIGAEDMEMWFEAYRQASGEEFAFIHLDAEWERPDWADVFLAVERVADARGIPVGVIYSGGEATSDDDWTRLAAERMFAYEQVTGGTPDHVVIQSWNDHPRRALPDQDPTTLTGLLNRYFGERAQIAAATTSDDSGTLSVELSLSTIDETGIPGAGMVVEAIPLDGQPQTLSVSGSVPANASTAVVVVRFNAESAGPGEADVRLYQVTFSEGLDTANRVPDGASSSQFESWTPYGDGEADVLPSDRGRGSMLRLTAAFGQPLFVDSQVFEVTPGAEFLFSVESSVPEASVGSGFIAVVFLDGDEVMRSVIDLAPVRERLGEVLSGADGAAKTRFEGLAGGRYLVRATFPGSLEFWSAFVENTVEVR